MICEHFGVEADRVAARAAAGLARAGRARWRRARARAQTAGTTVRAAGALVEPDALRPRRRPGARLRGARGAARSPRRVPKVRAAREAVPAGVRARLPEGPRRWQVSLFTAAAARRAAARGGRAGAGRRPRPGACSEAWTGVQVAWPMARGYPGAFGRAVNAPWVWIGLCVLFVLPFLRPPLRLLHLDLAVLLAFSVSYAFFGAAELERLGARAPTRCWPTCSCACWSSPARPPASRRGCSSAPASC